MTRQTMQILLLDKILQIHAHAHARTDICASLSLVAIGMECFKDLIIKYDSGPTSVKLKYII